MNLARILTAARRARTMPPRLAAQRALEIARGRLLDVYRRRRDATLPTLLSHGAAPVGALHHYLQALSLEVLRPHATVIGALAANYLDHRFDLLGSGWVQVKHGMSCRGLEGYHYDMGVAVDPDPGASWLNGRINGPNLAAARRVWGLVHPGYVPIDWHLDFKSGYRWSECTWYRDIPSGHLPGVDVKAPWELARMQHLPTLAWAYALASAGEAGFQTAEVYAHEFRNQILDFIATNPPRFGVNWRTTMDVAFRAANWLLAWDLFHAHGARFDGDFEAEFRRAIYTHGRHIISNLEWYPVLRGNHYLSDVAGLLFVAAYLPNSAETDAWLAFAVQELIAEARYQFTPDGASFEASTSYHRMTTQMVAFCTALVLGLPPEKRQALREYDARRHRASPPLRPAPLPHFNVQPVAHELPFPPDYVARLERMGEFAMHVLKPTGRIHQIGDNDSGQFFKLQPLHTPMTVAEARSLFANLAGYADLPDRATYWHYNDLDHRPVLSVIAGLFDRSDLAEVVGPEALDGHLIRALARGAVLQHSAAPAPEPAALSVRIGGESDFASLRARGDAARSRIELRVCLPKTVPVHDLVPLAYPGFGLYLFRSARTYLAIRCGPIGQAGNGGHAHNDQLSVELCVDGEDWLVDPGTYLYTPRPARRNEYRSVRSHFAPRVKAMEPGRLDLGLFALGNEAKAECLYFGPLGFCGRHRGYGAFVYRLVELAGPELRLVDFAEDDLVLSSPLDVTSPLYSPAYGVRERRAAIPRLG